MRAVVQAVNELRMEAWWVTLSLHIKRDCGCWPARGPEGAQTKKGPPFTIQDVCPDACTTGDNTRRDPHVDTGLVQRTKADNRHRQKADRVLDMMSEIAAYYGRNRKFIKLHTI